MDKFKVLKEIKKSCKNTKCIDCEFFSEKTWYCSFGYCTPYDWDIENMKGASNDKNRKN